jgi:protein TonB
MALNYASRRDPTRTAIGWGFVVLLHIVLFVAFKVALDHKDSPLKKEDIQTKVLEDENKPPPPPPPPPPPDFKPPPPEMMPQVEINIATPQVVTNAITTKIGPPPPVQAPAPVQHSVVGAVVDKAGCREPQYPSASQRLGEEGVVTLRMLIGVDGLVKAAEIQNSSGHARLDNAAKEALSLCKFKPKHVDGQPVEDWNAINYRWQLK